jgi:predicted nucleic acid-binding protein
MLTGIDTSYFFALAAGQKTAVDAWESRELLTSALCLYELQKKMLQGKLKNWPAILKDIEKAVEVIPLSSEIALAAGHIAHGTGIPAFDAIIISSFVISECTEILTTDTHFSRFIKKGIKITLL